MSLWSFSVRRWQFTLVVFALLIATGLWALSAIPRAEDPIAQVPGLAGRRPVSGRGPGGRRAPGRRPDRGRAGRARGHQAARQHRARRARAGRDRVHLRHGSGPQVRRGRARGQRRAALAARRRLLHRDRAQFTPGTVNIVQMALVSEKAGWRELEKHARGPRGADRDGARRAPRRDLGLPGTRSAGRDRSRTARGARADARPGDRRGPGREREHPGRRRGRRACAAST